MAKADTQSIPSEYAGLYDDTFSNYNQDGDVWDVGKRHPFRIPTLQGCRTIRPPIPRGSKVSDAMCEHRYVFGPCVECFNRQPATGGAEPDGRGGYSRTWWFNEAIGILPWYFNYFMRRTINAYLGAEAPFWCAMPSGLDANVVENDPDTNYGAEDTIRGAWNAGDRIWGYIKPPAGYSPSWLHLLCYNISRDIGDDGPWEWYIYTASTDWEEMTITWNNKPPLESKAQTLIWNENGYYKWHSFYIGRGKAAVITTKGDRNLGINFRSRHTAEAWRPFWS